MARNNLRAPLPLPVTSERSHSRGLVRGSNNTMRQLLYDFAYLGELNDALQRYSASELNLTSPQFNIMMYAYKAGTSGGVSIRDVAEYLHVSGPFITHEANKLEDRHLLIRTPNPADGRSTLLRLTAHAEAQMRAISEKVRHYDDRFFGRMDNDDLAQLMALLDRLIDGGESLLSEISAPKALRLIAHRKSAT
jgi:DNA-binding MarR family transcriptional regulator